MHIGQVIESEVIKFGDSPPMFAEKINMTAVGFRKVFEKKTIQIELLERISKELGVNLFRNLANEFDANHGATPQANNGVSEFNTDSVSGKCFLQIEIPESQKEQVLKLVIGQ